MDNKDLIAAIEEQEQFAQSGSLDQDREKALDQYLGNPYGNEIDGRSQIVMRDVMDTIEWIKPALMKIFASTDEVCVFNPVGPEDVEQAEQETDYVNHVLMVKNNGFLILHDWFHDALLQKNGYVVARPCTEYRSNVGKYKDLTDDEFALLIGNPEVQCTEHTEYLDGMGMTRHSCSVATKAEKRYIKVSNIPPERVRIASDWPGVSLQGCPFVEIVDYLTISQLRQMGYDVDDDINDSSNLNEEFEERRNENQFISRTDIEADPATRRVTTRFVWMNYDENKDGIAELLYIVIVGSTILELCEDDITPVAAITPQRMPHEHVGLSVNDAVEDLQAIRTSLVRGFLDNMYLANNGRNAIDASRVNLDDMLTSRPGGVIRVTGDPNGAIIPIVHPQVGQAVLQAVEYIDSVRENRTGVTRYNQGIDANSLNKTATGINAIQNASMQRIELIARLFAETGVKDLMRIIHALSMKHSKQVEMVKLSGKWVPVDPSSWKTRDDLTVAVGVGTGNKDQQLVHLQQIWQMQGLGMQFGIATPENLYHTASKLTQNAGFKQTEQFWKDPGEGAPPPQPPNPQLQIEQMKQQADVQKYQADMANEKQKEQDEKQARVVEMAFEADQKEKDRQTELALEKYKADKEAELAKEKIEADKWKAKLTAETQIYIERMKTSGLAVDPDTGGSVLDTVRENMSQLLAEQQATSERLMAKLAERSGPKQFPRGPDGKVLGVQYADGSMAQLIRGPDGKVIGLH